MIVMNVCSDNSITHFSRTQWSRKSLLQLNDFYCLGGFVCYGGNYAV